MGSHAKTLSHANFIILSIISLRATNPHPHRWLRIKPASSVCLKTKFPVCLEPIAIRKILVPSTTIFPLKLPSKIRLIQVKIQGNANLEILALSLRRELAEIITLKALSIKDSKNPINKIP